MRMSRYVAVLVAGALLGTAPLAVAKDAATKAAIKCRKALAKSSIAAVKGGLKALDKCHGKRDKGKFSGDCNVVPTPQGKLAGAMQKACGNAPDVLQNFTGGDAAGQIAAAIQSALQASGNELQGSPSLNGDKAKIKCHGAIGKGRSLIVNGIVRGAAGCQKGRDKNATTFGPLAGDCVLGAGSGGTKASGKIAKACGSTSGADVDSCDSLPVCVVDDATATGQQIARGVFSSGGGPAVPECHDGHVDPGEACDPGLFDTDTCVNCQPAGCGDGVTMPPNETCDDGNTTAGDGCSATCQLETPPGGSVVTVVVSLTHDPAITGDLAGAEIGLGYNPAKVSIPGTADDPLVSGRVRNIGPQDVLWNVSDRDTDTNGQDDQLFMPYGRTDVLPPGPILEAVFDGAPGASVGPADFTCTVLNAVDPLGTPVGGITCGVTVSVDTGTATTSTTTTTNTTTTT